MGFSHSDNLGYSITHSNRLHIWRNTHLKYSIPYDSSDMQFSHVNINANGKIKTGGKIIALASSNNDRYFATSANNTSFFDLTPEENSILSSRDLYAEI